jgi:hypothetical protein
VSPTIPTGTPIATQRVIAFPVFSDVDSCSAIV